jgi:hypothetical protein
MIVADGTHAVVQRCTGRVFFNLSLKIQVILYVSFKVRSSPLSTSPVCGKSLLPPNLGELEHITPNLCKLIFYPPNFLKQDKSPSKAVLKNYSKLQKNHKVESPIVLDSK